MTGNPVCYSSPGSTYTYGYTPNICNDTISSGGHYPCCAVGDTCLPNNICHFTHSQAGTSGYYVSSCTDPSFQDSSCNQECLDVADPNIVYNQDTGLWACCVSIKGQSANCSNPSSETFELPAPQALLSSTVALLTASPTVHSSSFSTNSATTTSVTATVTVTSSAAASSGLSGGTDAAIALGAILGVVLLGALAALFVMRGRRRKTTGNASEPMQHPPVEAAGRDRYFTDKNQSYNPSSITHQVPYNRPQSEAQYNSGELPRQELQS